MENNKEALLWSIALPGFGQLLNGKYLKGIIFISLEFIINVQSHFNEIILHSFNGDIVKAIERTDYQWLMFYPCVYFFAMWDAFKDAGGGKEPYSYLPFVFSAYFVTVGLMYSEKAKIFGLLFGTVWFPMLCVIPGVVIGILLKKILRNFYLNNFNKNKIFINYKMGDIYFNNNFYNTYTDTSSKPYKKTVEWTTVEYITSRSE